MLPVISVILPVYNREAFVASAIQSILDQTYKDFELIIIDDASIDSSLTVINGFNDKRIRLLRNDENLGVSASRNRGIKEAKGEYIAFMDSDDISVPERFARQILIFSQFHDLLICGSWMLELKNSKKLKYKENHEEILIESLFRSPFANPTIMIKKVLYKNALYNEELKYGEDYEFWSRTMWKGRMYNIQEPLVIYNVHSNQLSTRFKKQQLERDVKLRLVIFKKIDYSRESFSDEIIERVLLFNSFFSPKDLKIFLKWLKVLEKNNIKKGIFSPSHLKIAIGRMRQDLIFKIFFTDSDFGINRRWRLQALKELDKKDLMKVIGRKLRQYVKIYRR